MAAALAVTSCDLTRLPQDKLTEDTFFESEAGLQAFSNAFYNDLPGAASLYTEDVDNYFQMTQLLEARGKRTVPASGNGWTWTTLRDYNTLIDNADQCTDSEVRNRYVAVARFFRAQFYFDKVKRFGDVPWIDHQLGSSDPLLYAARDSRELVMQNIIEDLDYAIANLPKTRTVYTVNKWTAMALKSRVCLFEGTFRKYHGLNQYEHDADWYLKTCAEASKEFINNSGYSIYDGAQADSSYIKLFTTNTIQGSDVEKEIILARNYNAEYSVTHNSNYTFTTMSMGKYGMSRKAVASYLMKDGSRFTDKPGWETMTFVDEVKDRDPRLAQSIRTPGYSRIGDKTPVAPNLAQSITGYQPIKYVGSVSQDAYNMADNDLILFRAAEVLLNYAEAKAELGTIDQDDLDKSVNKLRARVGMPKLTTDVTEDHFLTDLKWGGYQNVSGSTRALILEIRRERMVELNQEGFRYYDLMRWKEGKIFEQQMYGMYFPGVGEYDLDGDGKMDLLLWSGTKPSSAATVVLELDKDVILSQGDKGMINPFKDSPGSWDESKDYLYPIPINEFSLNDNLEQNPGW